MNYEDFYDSFMSDVNYRALGDVTEDTQEGRLPDFLENSFTEFFLEALDERGVADGATVCYHFSRTTKGNVKMNAWAINLEEGLLTLCTTIYSPDYKNVRLPKATIEDAYKQIDRLFNLAKSGYHENMEPSSETFKVFSTIYDNINDVNRINYILITNGILPMELRLPTVRDGNYAYNFDSWDLTRLHRLTEAERPYESRVIDLVDRFGKGIPCLPAEFATSDHRVHLAVIPGEVLCRLYEEFGHNLLDLNVRSFLQVKGGVNKGIRDTLCKEPNRFLAYNNGITATVETMEMTNDGHGQHLIVSMTGFQVVNGGQTMASIHRAAKKDKADISNVFVQAKITEMDPEIISELAPKISRFANSQNKVSDADFSSNDPVHVEIQRLSEIIWAPGQQTRWYYERTRGQYHVDRNRRAPTPAQARRFDAQHPSRQRLTKTDLAKFENSWDQKPFIVSLGAQKNFVKFMSDLRKERGENWLPDEKFFKELVAKAIIFKAADSVAKKAHLDSYKANVVTYMVAYLSRKCIGRLDLEEIWNRQEVPASIKVAFESWVHSIHEELVDSAGTRNVTEWCKKLDCWVNIMNMTLDLPADLRSELDAVQPEPTVGHPRHSLSQEDRDNIARTMSLTDRQWFDLAGWGRNTGNLQKWQSDIAITLSGYAQENWVTVPSARQAAQAVKMIDIAIENSMPGLSMQSEAND